MVDPNETLIQKMQKELDTLKETITSMSSIKSEPLFASQNISSIQSKIPAIQTFHVSGILTGESNYKIWVRSIRNTLGYDLYQYITTGKPTNFLIESDLASWEEYSIKVINAAIDPVKILPLLLEIPEDKVSSYAYWTTLKNRSAPKDSQESLRLISQFWRIPPVPTTEDGFGSWADGATALVRDM